MNRRHWYVALLQAGLLAIFACSSDETTPGDTSSAGGSDWEPITARQAERAPRAERAAPPDRSRVAQGPMRRSPTRARVERRRIRMFRRRRPTRIRKQMSAMTSPPMLRLATPEPAMSRTPRRAAEHDAASDAAVDAPSSGCTGDLQCQGGAWRCDLNSHACVPCLPGASDNCPAGQYCTAQFACVAGCKGNGSCASGVCTNHQCEHCQNDLECAAGNVCGSGVCAPACSAQVACSNGFECCGGHCVSLAHDINHCGGCPSACSRAQYCSSTGCTVVSIANVCGNGANDDAAQFVSGGQRCQCGSARRAHQPMCAPAHRWPDRANITRADQPEHRTTGRWWRQSPHCRRGIFRRVPGELPR